MRISTNQLYDRNIRAIMDNQRGLSETQNELSTGKKLNKPSDDPVGAAKVIRLTEELDKLKQYQRNNDFLVNALEQQETVFDSINNTATRARTLILQAGSGALSDSDRKAIGIELGQMRDEMLGLMNSQDANGNYIFGGHQSQNQPFVFNGGATNAVSYQGDSGQNTVKLADGVEVQRSVSGQDVFENVLARRNFSVVNTPSAVVESSGIDSQKTFDAFSKANYDPVTPANNTFQLQITAANQVTLTNPGTGETVGSTAFTPSQPFSIQGMTFTLSGNPGDSVEFALDPPQKKNLAETLHDVSSMLMDDSLTTDAISNALDDALIGLDNGVDKVAQERSSVGGRLNLASSMYQTNADLQIEAKKIRSSIEDVDFAEAATELTKRETALNAAYSSFGKVTGLSLFNYIK
ncbi:flagellar hook-associated protein FlgL [Salinimonas sp. HHU 13199]|uniref:Flagellar hook-associated protein FlgL n=1 Tax=Salinimonas profundi TaxID=2729140 RepID=A0ABR8LGH1_9ALTE|nr:flagellar hook-associated protein FlgL [Salinimonas profundi]MBD3585355.1 flagellar hook-associated protein FlgL [Salinimonas profundi]